MTNYDNLWNKTKPSEFQTTEYSEVPDGTYQAFIEKVTFKETKEPHQVSFQWRITGPTEAKRVVFSNYKMHEKGAARLKRDIADFGLTVVDYASMANELQYLVGKTGTIKLVTTEFQGKDFQNVWYEPRKTTETKTTTAKTSNTIRPKFDDTQDIPF